MYQMKEVILCKYGEVILKGTNKKTFENQLMNEVRRRAALVGSYTVRYNQSTVYVEPNNEEAEDMLDVMYAQIRKVFGFAGVCRAAVCEKTLESILEKAREYLPEK